MFVAFLFLSCGGNSETSWVTGWAIGWSENEETGVSQVKILQTSNGGISWTLQSVPEGCAGFRGNDISAVSREVAWAAVGHPDEENLTGGILMTTDGGASWNLQMLPGGMKSEHIKNIKGINESESWAVSLRGDVLHTIDGGSNWQIVPVRTSLGDIIEMTQVNRRDVVGNNIWIVDAVGGAQGVIHSADGGETWRRETLPHIEYDHSPLAVSVFDSSIAWAAVNSEGNLWWTSDGGDTWNKSDDALAGTMDYDDILASSPNIVWIACNGDGSSGGFVARVIVTNGNFEANIFNYPPYMMEGVSALNDNVAWAVGQKLSYYEPDLPLSAIFHTIDGGAHWSAQALPENARDVTLWKVSFVGAKR